MVIADTVKAQLQTWARDHRPSGTPFFLGLGIHKPHLPWAVPRRFKQQLPQLEDIPLAKHQLPPVGMPDVAHHACNWGYFPFGWRTRDQIIDETIAHEARLAYYAAVSFADSLVGSVLDELRAVGADNTSFVLLTSDHGWQLGEHNEWCKETLFELSLHIPLLIRPPPAAARYDGVRGTHTTAFASLIDLYKTMSDLAGLPAPEAGVDGVSVAPLLLPPAERAPGFAPATSAISQHARCFTTWFPNGTTNNETFTPFNGADSCTVVPRDRLDLMGFSVRTAAWRYTEWRRWKGDALAGDWTPQGLNATELYAHADAPAGTPLDFDAAENVNVAGDAANAAVVQRLARLLRERFEEGGKEGEIEKK